MIRRARMASGLVLFAYVVVHLVNHSLGIVSLGAMEAMLAWVHPVWTSVPGTLAIYGAFLVHVGLAFFALWERRLLQLRPLEALQYVLGFSIPVLAATHVTGTRINDSFLGGDGSHYVTVLTALWYGEPLKGVVQIVLLFVAWTHVCIGLWFWLRLRPWYPTARPLLSAAAVLLPVLAFLGFVAAERELGAMLAQDPGLLARTLASQARPENRLALVAIAWVVRITCFAAIAGVLVARVARHHWQRRHGVSRVTYPGGRWIDIAPGFTVLEASQLLGVPHTSICGGKGRCSTCRIGVRGDAQALPPPTPEEERVLRRIGAPANVRLACQLRPRGPISVVPLTSSPQAGRQHFRRPAYADGSEREIVVLFADLRDFTRLAESRLPYDVLFILNRFCQEMGQAIEAAGGYVDKFIGDGVMALFGLDATPAHAAAQALQAARSMFARLADLNGALADDLTSPLRMGVGIHVGPALVGEIGYGRSRSLTAVGDTVNIASRLQTLTKSHGCELVVSEDLLHSAGLDLLHAPRHETEIRGRDAPIAIRTLARVDELAATVPTADAQPAAAAPGWAHSLFARLAS
jgi:adenylate cyclase